MYKIVLMDYSMPEMDGPTTATEIKSLFKNSATLSESSAPYICCCTAY